MFIDSAIIFCEAGHGGNGCNSSERGRRNVRHRRPTGGDAGPGGSVVLVASPHVHTLLDLQMRKTFRAENGKHGGANHMSGAVGADLEVSVPLGTEVHDEETGMLLKDLVVAGARVVVARGGAGGKGNHKRAAASSGEPGETRAVRLELKLIADIGVVGFPNAGKSTLISRVSNAKSKIAPYPFTTKEPILGVVKHSDGDSLVVADIPGLIEGAHEGRGLGLEFLRHIERTKFFLELVDMAGADGRDPVRDYEILNEELVRYSPEFGAKPRVVVANKMDIPAAAENLVKFKNAVRVPVFEISAATGRGIPELVNHLFERIARGNSGEA